MAENGKNGGKIVKIRKNPQIHKISQITKIPEILGGNSEEKF